MSVPQQLGHFTGLSVVVEGKLGWACVVCQRLLYDGEGALMAQSGQPWRVYCFTHQPADADGEQLWQIGVENVRSAEALLIEMAAWIELLWTPNFGPLIFALGRCLRNDYLERLSEQDQNVTTSGDVEPEVISSDYPAGS
jgi:hypothetical protein